MSDAINPAFYAKVNERLDAMIGRFYESAPAAQALSSSRSVDKELFKRHTVETILRIRLARIADSIAIRHFTKADPFAAQKWSKYTEEEMLHDRLFLKDLKNLGMSEEEVYGAEPLLATKLLQGYLYYTLEHEGPRGLLSKSYFVEYTTKKTQAAWNANVKRSLGQKAVKGAEAHLSYDLAEDHSTDVWNVLMTLVHTQADEERVLFHLDVYFGLFTAYFNELAARFQADSELGASDTVRAVVEGAERAGRAASGRARGAA